jgi:hypothetical protein
MEDLAKVQQGTWFTRPSFWLEMPSVLKSDLAEYGTVASVYAHYCLSFRDDTRQLSAGLLAKTMFDGDLLDRKCLLLGATGNIV